MTLQVEVQVQVVQVLNQAFLDEVGNQLGHVRVDVEREEHVSQAEAHGCTCFLPRLGAPVGGRSLYSIPELDVCRSAYLVPEVYKTGRRFRESAIEKTHCLMSGTEHNLLYNCRLLLQ